MRTQRKSYTEKMVEHIDEVFYYWDVVYDKLSKLHGKNFVDNHPEIVANLVQAIAIKDVEASLLDLNEDINDNLKYIH